LLPVFISSFEAVSVTLGAPEAALFAVPADYREVKDPTEDRLRAFIARNGRRGR
jgi:hypothetical protein